MNYLDTYFSRINHMGDTTAERIRNSGIRSFYKWLAESPHTVRNLSIERGLHFDGLILTDKDKSYQKIMYLNVANTVPLLVGDIMNWTLDDGSIEKWILLQEEKKANGTYRTFWIVRCNYLLKWIDDDGHLQQSWAYVVSSVDSKIKGNFRTWNALITPQPNKYAEILMPRYPISRATNFIVEDESWTVVELDHTSVPGVIYLSLTENKVNFIYDDLVNDIADTDKLATYNLLLPEETQSFDVNTVINPVYTLTKNGKPVVMDVEYIPQNTYVAKVINGELTAVGEGETDITVRLKDVPTIMNTLHIRVGPPQAAFSAYIEGNASIKLNRSATYTLIGTDEISGNVVYSISTKLAKIISSDGASCVVKANDKNELGTCILTAEYNGNTYSKEIAIIPVW